MRLFELIDFEQKPKKRYSGKFKNKGKRWPNSKKGVGSRSKVKDHPTIPFMVDKYNYIPTENIYRYDPFWMYAEYLIKTNRQSKNPYFPRLYMSKDIYDMNGMMVRKLSMEKLEPLTNASMEELDAYMTRLFGPEQAEILDIKKMDKEWVLDWITQSIFETIAFYGPNSRRIDISGSVNWIPDFKGEIVDKELLEALGVIYRLRSAINKRTNKRVHLDIFVDNVMMRRSKYGIQPVITDPFNRAG